MVVYDSTGLYLLSTRGSCIPKGYPQCFQVFAESESSWFVFVSKSYKKLYKFYGWCSFVLEKYLRVWGCRDSSVSVMSTEVVTFDSQQGEFFVLRSVQTGSWSNPASYSTGIA